VSREVNSGVARRCCWWNDCSYFPTSLLFECRRCWSQSMSRGNLKQGGIYLFFLINNLLVNLPGIPVGTLRGLDSDGRCFLSSAP
jgi:hypothetical protein